MNSQALPEWLNNERLHEWSIDLDPVVSRWALEQVMQIVCNSLKSSSSDAAVILFGSWATGKVHRLSDVDVAILPRKPLPIELLAEIREELEESHVPYHVDLVDISICDLQFRERVLQEGITWAA